MFVLALLLSPRGAIRRRAFGLGLVLLLGLDLAIYFALALHGMAGLAGLPVVGPWAVGTLLDMGPASSQSALGLNGWAPGLMILALQAWISGVLCLKRLRAMGVGPWPLILVWALNIAQSTAMAAWAARLDEMAVILPMYGAMAVSLLLWLVLIGWLGVARAKVAETAAFEVEPQVKPLS